MYQYVTVSAKTSLVHTFIFGPAYSYTHAIAIHTAHLLCMARLKWSAFLSGGFTAF